MSELGSSIAEAILVDQQIADLDNYTGPTWNVQPMSQILESLASKRTKNNVQVHKSTYGEHYRG